MNTSKMIPSHVKKFTKKSGYKYHPPYRVMIGNAIICLNHGSKGTSRYAIKKYLYANWRVNVNTLTTQVNLSLNREVKKGNLVKVKGSFKTTPKFKKYIIDNVLK